MRRFLIAWGVGIPNPWVQGSSVHHQRTWFSRLQTADRRISQPPYALESLPTVNLVCICISIPLAISYSFCSLKIMTNTGRFHFFKEKVFPIILWMYFLLLLYILCSRTLLTCKLIPAISSPCVILLLLVLFLFAFYLTRSNLSPCLSFLQNQLFFLLSVMGRSVLQWGLFCPPFVS